MLRGEAALVPLAWPKLCRREAGQTSEADFLIHLGKVARASATPIGLVPTRPLDPSLSLFCG